MGFLKQAEIERIWLDSEEEEPQWWVDVKLGLSVEEAEEAEEALLRTRTEEQRTARGKTRTVVRGELRVLPHMFEMVLCSIVDWNLTDENNQLLSLEHNYEIEKKTGVPSARRQALKRIPQSAYDRLTEVVMTANAPMSREESQSFREGDPVDAPRQPDGRPYDPSLSLGGDLVAQDGPEDRPTAPVGASTSAD
jgi:hypothetical protein